MKPWKFWLFLSVQTLVQTAFACILFLMYVHNQGPDELIKKIAKDGAECYVYRNSIDCNHDMQNVWTRFNSFPFVGEHFANDPDEKYFYKDPLEVNND